MLRSAGFVALLLAIYLGVAFFTVRDNPFLVDDRGIIYKGIMNCEHPDSILQPDHAGRNHLVAFFFLGAVYELFGLHPSNYYAALLVLHTLNFLLLMAVAGILGLSKRGAAIAAVFFLVLSTHHQVVAWIGNSTRLVMAFFFLGSFLGFHFFRKTGRKILLVLSCFLWILALHSSEDAVMLPILFVGYDVLVLRRNLFSKEESGSRAMCFLLFFMALAFLSVEFFLYGEGIEGISVIRFKWWHGIAGALWTLINLIIPRREILQYVIEPDAFARAFVPGAALALLLPVVYRCRREILGSRDFLRIALFSGFWFVLMIAPFSLRPNAHWMTYPPPRYFYLPMMGFSFFVGKVAENMMTAISSFESVFSRRAALVCVGIAAIYFFVLNVWTFSFMADKIAVSWESVDIYEQTFLAGLPPDIRSL